uniref:Uncharacterized protein n=1 Tax=Anopheles melas TaxID=34690 RepID=A0A182UKA7_9DIPT
MGPRNENIQETTIVMIPNGNSKSDGAVLEKEMRKHHLAGTGNRPKGVPRLATTHELPSDEHTEGGNGCTGNGTGNADQDLWPTKGATTCDRRVPTVGFRLPPGRSAVRPRQTCEMSKQSPANAKPTHVGKKTSNSCTVRTMHSLNGTPFEFDEKLQIVPDCSSVGVVNQIKLTRHVIPHAANVKIL